MNTFLKSEEFDAWLISLKDHVGKAMITKRIRNAEAGNFGDCEPVGEGVSELRIHTVPAIALILPVEEIWFIFCCWAEISPPKNVISSVPKRWRAL